MEGLARSALIAVSIGRVAIVHADDRAVSFDAECDAIIRTGHDLIIAVHDIDLDVAQAASICLDLCLFRRQAQIRRVRIGRDRLIAFDHIFGDHLIIFIISDRPERSGTPVHIERRIEFTIRESLIRISGIRSVRRRRIGADELIVQIEFDLMRVGIHIDLHLAVDLDDLIIIPVGHQMHDIAVLIPQALIQIIDILFKAGRIHDAEIRRFRLCALTAYRSDCCAVPRGRLADVIKSGPDKLTGIVIVLDDQFPGIAGGKAPVDLRVVVVILGQLQTVVIL